MSPNFYAITRVLYLLRHFELMVAFIPSPENELRNPLSPHMSVETPSTLPSVNGDTIRPLLKREHSSNSITRDFSSDINDRHSSQTLATRDSDFNSEYDLQSIMRLMLAIQEGPSMKQIIPRLLGIVMETAGANYGCIMLRGQHEEKKLLYIEVIMNGPQIRIVDHQPLHAQVDMVPTRLCESVCSYAN